MEYEVMLSDIKKYVYSKNVYNTLYLEKKQKF